MARHDELTGLPNRRAFLEQLREQIDVALETGDHMVAVAMVDVDHFKDINDTLGHSCEDHLIRLLPERFARGLPTGAVVSRFGGDEFAIAITARDEQEVLINFESLVKCFSDPFMLRGHVLSVTISAGVAFAPVHSQVAEDLLRYADIALYEAKAQGRNRMFLFEAGLEALKRDHMALEFDMRTAIEKDELELRYQPYFSPDASCITGLESLLFWNHPERGVLPAAEFVPIAEHSALIGPIGAWVTRRVFDDAVRWPELRVAISLSPVQLRDPGFLASLQRLITETNIDPRRFDFQITENTVLDHRNQRVRHTLMQIHNWGFGISVDGFGAGYSSINSLRQMPIDALKIDHSFIKDIETSSQAECLARVLISLGQSLGLSVTAGGVETVGQLRLLQNAGCRQLQGSLLGGIYTHDAIQAQIGETIISDPASPV